MDFSRSFIVLLFSVYTLSTGIDEALVESDSYSEFQPDSPHHRSRRSVSVADVRPTFEFPLVLFSCDDYNTKPANCTDGTYTRVPPNEFRVWGETNTEQLQVHYYRSFRLMDNHNVTFKACCSSGNTYAKSMYNPGDVSSIHYWMFNNSEVGGSEGIWYTDWPHFPQEFSIMVQRCSSCKPVNCTCYFGTCDVNSKCNCAPGYSGTKCETGPPNTESYPSVAYPLILFPNTDFKGTPKKVKGDSFETFAQNRDYTRKMVYQSMRTLYNWAMVFARDSRREITVSPGTDISDLDTYLRSNTDTANDVWYNYASTIEADFQIKVQSVPACASCNGTGACCYSGSCKCLPGYSGANCENSP